MTSVLLLVPDSRSPQLADVKLGTDLNRVRQQVIQLLDGHQGWEPAS